MADLAVHDQTIWVFTITEMRTYDSENCSSSPTVDKDRLTHALARRDSSALATL